MGFGLKKEVVERIVSELGLQSAVDKIPTDIIPSIQPVLISNAERNTRILAVGKKPTSGLLSVFSSLSDRDTFVTGIQFSFSKDATCDVATGDLIVTLVEEETRKTVEVAKLAVITTTAERDTFNIQFKNPIKIHRGSDISIGANTYTAGLMSRTLVIYGYEVV